VSALPAATVLALDRTRLALERTTMAWVRTAASLITFGFSVYKFFSIESRKAEIAERLVGPREFGLMMITVGLIALFIATIQHWHTMRSLRAHYAGTPMPRSLAALVGGLMSVLGIIALIAVIARA
jgi:putative membrane protein